MGTKDIIRNILKNLSVLFANNLKNISSFVQLSIPLFILTTIWFDNEVNFLGLLFITLTLEFCSGILKFLSVINNSKKNIKNGMPIPRKEFVKENGSKVTIESSDIYELLIYTSELQKYLKREGLM